MKKSWIVGALATSLFIVNFSAGVSIAQGNAPFAGGAGKPEQKDPEAEKLEAAALKLEKELKAKPNDSKLKMKVAEAFYQSGHAKEYSAKLGAKAKYRGALKDYRIALTYNPNHKEAAKEKTQIEDIYKQMGIKVP